MPGPRDTDSDMGYVGKPTLELAWAELRRMRKGKADSNWVRGEFKEDRLKHRHLKEQVMSLGNTVSDIQKDDREVANKASQARRIAKEAKEIASAHRCIHEHTLGDLETNVGTLTSMMQDQTKSKKRTNWVQGISFVLFVCTVAGAIVTWRTDAEVGKKERIELKKDVQELGQKIESKSREDVQGMTAAFKKALKEHEKEMEKESQ